VCVTVDGGWAEWTLWSVCSSECERQRTRECTDPEPKHGGRLCDGAALDTDNCTGDLCIQGGESVPSSSSPSFSSLLSSSCAPLRTAFKMLLKSEI